MFVVVWQFEISEEKIAAFEAAYSPQGAWAQLFGASPEYRGTELLRDAYIPGNYLTIDRWASAPSAFRSATTSAPCGKRLPIPISPRSITISIAGSGAAGSG